MKTFLHITKKALLWILSILFLLIGLVYIPSISSFFAFAVVALVLPIQKWQTILGKAVKSKLKIILAIVFVIMTFSCVPVTPETENDNVIPNTEPVRSTIISETPNKEMSVPTDAPTKTPTSSPILTTTPTLEPTAKPTAEPTATPTVTPSPTPIPVLKEHSSGQAVIELQERLIELGYLDEAADGEFGSGTKNAVIEFQKNSHIAADGVAGKDTLTVLYSDNAVRQRWVWIPTNGGTKFHSKSGCSSMKNPKRITYREAIELGYDSCGRCH